MSCRNSQEATTSSPVAATIAMRPPYSRSGKWIQWWVAQINRKTSTVVPIIAMPRMRHQGAGLMPPVASKNNAPVPPATLMAAPCQLEYAETQFRS